MTLPTEKIAAKVAHALWNYGGEALAHTALFVLSNQFFNLLNRKSEKKRSIFSWINPIPTVKKLGGWLGLEAVAQTVKTPISQAWAKAAPIAEKTITPILESIIKPIFNTLMKKGYISEVKIKEPSWTDWISHLTPSKLHPASLATSLSNSLAQTINTRIDAFNTWWHAAAPIITQNTDESLYEIADKNAPMIGQAIAEGLEKTCQYAFKIARVPGEAVEAISEATHLSVPAVIAGGTGLLLLSYVGVKGWNYMRNHVEQNTTVTTSATAKIGDIHVHVSAPTAGGATKNNIL